MKKLEYATVYTAGAFAYSLMEIVFRGFTHWTMAVAGGCCFLSFHILNCKRITAGILKKCFWGCCIITCVEFFTGCIVNLIFKLNVWDYSGRFLNLWGQICPLFSLIWYLMGIPMAFFSGIFRKLFLRSRSV